MPRRPSHIPPVGPFAANDCLRCGYHWEAYRPDRRPVACPQCGTRLWAVPPTLPTDRRPSDPPNPKWAERRGTACPACGRRLPQPRTEPERKRVRRSPKPAGTATVVPGPITLDKIQEDIRRLNAREEARLGASMLRGPMYDASATDPPPGLTPPPMRISVPAPPPIEQPVRDVTPEPALMPEELVARRGSPAGTLSEELASELELTPTSKEQHADSK